LILLPYPPSNNTYYRHFKGRTVLSAKGREFKRVTSAIYIMHGLPVLSGSVHVKIELHPRTTATGAASKVRLDLDNCLKSICDGLQGVAYGNDAQIVAIHASIAHPIKGGGVSVMVSSC
jgi:crossover junction endodeoxyribonuclease RusA